MTEREFQKQVRKDAKIFRKSDPERNRALGMAMLRELYNTDVITLKQYQTWNLPDTQAFKWERLN